jgi:hypothetical protein
VGLPDIFDRKAATFDASRRGLHHRSRRKGWQKGLVVVEHENKGTGMLPSTSTKTLLLWTASLAVAALSGFGVGLYVSSRPKAPRVENLPNETHGGTASLNSDSEDDINDLEDIAKVKAGVLEPCKMVRTLHVTPARSSNHSCRSSW